jgi:hypothetical protein
MVAAADQRSDNQIPRRLDLISPLADSCSGSWQASRTSNICFILPRCSVAASCSTNPLNSARSLSVAFSAQRSAAQPSSTVPIATDAPQQTASLFDHLVTRRSGRPARISSVAPIRLNSSAGCPLSAINRHRTLDLKMKEAANEVAPRKASMR